MRVGMIVHYVSYGTPGGEYTSECRAAIITEIPQPDPSDFNHHRVGLCVLNPTGQFFNRGLDHGPTEAVTEQGVSVPKAILDSSAASGTWHHLAECSR